MPPKRLRFGTEPIELCTEPSVTEPPLRPREIGLGAQLSFNAGMTGVLAGARQFTSAIHNLSKPLLFAWGHTAHFNMSRPQQNRAETPISQGGPVLHGLFLAFALRTPGPTAILSDE